MTSVFSATIEGEVFGDQDVRNLELARARHALNYLKDKLGDEQIKALLHDDLQRTTQRNEAWLAASNGQWKSGHVFLQLPETTAKDFWSWFTRMVERKDDKAFRIAHPEHFLTKFLSENVDVIENVGEDDDPWNVKIGDFSSIDAGIPVTADPAFPLGVAATVRSVNDKIIAYAVHEFRDNEGGAQAKLTLVLPSAAPYELISRHLRHFSVEWRNWWVASIAEK